MKYNYIFFYILFFALPITISAQGKHVLRGTVSDATDNSRIIGATVAEYDEGRRIIRGTITDFDGNFTLTIESRENIIAISFLGYKTQEIKLKAQENDLDIKLEPSVEVLGVVTITAQSVKRNPLTGVSDRDNAGSMAKLDMKESEHGGITSAADALQGVASGIDIMSSGTPGGGSQITIRGLSSLGGASPLIVIDGIAQDVSLEDDFDLSSADEDDIGDLVNISPQDIADIVVLKDAATAALWGSKGADGVLQITTKRGTRGKTRFQYSGRYTMDFQPPAIPMLNGDEYITMQLEENHNAYGLFNLDDRIAYDRNYSDFHNYNKNTDWLSAITRVGEYKEHDFNISGGGDKTTYRVSFGYGDQAGTTLNEGLKKLSTRINLDYKISKKLKFNIDFNYSNVYKEANYKKGLGVREMAYIKAPNMSIYEHDQYGNLTGEYFSPISTYQGAGSVYYNPVAMVDLSVNDQDQHNVQNTFVLNYEILPWLTSVSTLSYRYINTTKNYFLPSAAIGVDWLHSLNDLAKEGKTISTRVMTREALFIKPKIANKAHQFMGNLLFETESNDGESVTIQSSNGAGYIIQDPAAVSHVYSLQSSRSQTRGLGALGGFFYKYDDRYSVQGNLRMDASSKFGANERWGLFPSVMGAWYYSEENFLSGLDFLSYGKISASWGRAGKQPNSAYGRHSYYNAASPNMYINSEIIVPSKLQLENLKWQTVTSWNVAWDAALFKNRLDLSVEVYSKLTEDMLWNNYDIAKSSGYSVLSSFNGGSVKNAGWEATAKVKAIKRPDFLLSFDFNISHNENAFIEFPENLSNISDANIGNGVYPRRADVGSPVGSFYGFIYEGVWASDEAVMAYDALGKPLKDINGAPIPLTYNNEYEFKGGDAKYKDVNNDGNIDLLDVVYLGDSNPDFIGALGTTVNWKNFKFRARFVYRTGFQIVNQIASTTEGMNNKNNQSKAVLKRWRTQGQDEEGMIPRAYMLHVANNLGSDRYVEDADYLRLNTVSLSYELSKRYCKSLGVSNLSFGLAARKILTLTNYSGQDPEVSQNGSDPFWFGVDDGKTPASRSYVLSMNIKF